MDYIIRQAGQNDLSGVTRVFIEVAKDPSVSIASPSEMLAKSPAIRDYLEASADPEFPWHALVVLVDNEIVGVCDILRTPLQRTSHVAELGLGILSPYRGHGLGRALMEAALKWMKANGITKARLFVLKDNQIAQNLYKSMGFVQTGVYRDEVKNHTEFMDLLVMERFL